MTSLRKINPFEESRMNGSNSRESRPKMKWYGVGIIAAALLILPGKSSAQGAKGDADDRPANPVQIVALDECDPVTFNADPNPDPASKKKPGLGPDFCRNVTLGAFTTLQKLFDKAAAGTPDPSWDFEPDTVKINKGTPIVVVDEGGEPHTFTEVKQFGGGFVTKLNNGEETVSECSGGFGNIAVARTRILQGSQFLVPNLSQGEHLFQCCIHPWMRVKVEVQDHGTQDKDK
jgi:plastocyanin